MKSTDIVQPYAMAATFAENVFTTTGSDDFELPAATTTSPNDTCVQDDGFLPITSEDLDEGGIAPERKNFNAMFYLATDQRNYIQNGGLITFNQDVSDEIGGYPQGAVLDYIDVNNEYHKVISLIDDNTNNFVTTPTLIDDVNWKFLEYGNFKDANIDLSNLSPDGEARLGGNIRGIINDGNLDANGHLDLIDAGTSSDTTYEYSEARDYTITLASAGNYEVSLIGGGGYGSGSFAYPNPACTAGGGSGAGFIGTITLAAGTYTITVGGNTRDGNRDTVLKDSSNNIIIKAGGGGNGSASSYSVSATGGAGGVLTNNATVVGSPTLSTNGNAGGRNTSGGGAAPGNSVYDNTITGYGAGGRTSVYAGGAAGYAGVAGYFKLKINSVPSVTIDYKVTQANPLTITDFSGKQTTFYSLNTDLATSLADGTYNKFLDENGSELIKNTIYAQLKEPTTPSTNDVWIRTTDKVQSFKYDGADWQSYNKVWLGSVDISSGGASNAVNAELCNNNFNVTTYQHSHYIVKVKTASGLWSRLYNDGWLEQGGNKTNPLTGNAGTFDIDFLDSFGNTNYYFFRNPVWTQNNTNPQSDVYAVGCTSKSNNKVSVGCHASTYVASIDWYACGYIS